MHYIHNIIISTCIQYKMISEMLYVLYYKVFKMYILQSQHIATWTAYVSSTQQLHGASDSCIYCIGPSRLRASK